jgi:NAD(P)-dependent dehydrogenase (short-subunit alcohol dehydrogenase family)
MGIGQGIARELARQGLAVAIQYARSEAGARQAHEGWERARERQRFSY